MNRPLNIVRIISFLPIGGVENTLGMLMYTRRFRFLDCLIRWRFTLRASLWLLLPLVVAPCLALAR